jgi:hypothetical protein
MLFKKFEIDPLLGNGSFSGFGDQAVKKMLEDVNTNNMTPEAFGELSDALQELSLSLSATDNAFRLDVLNFEQLLTSYSTNTDILRDLNGKRIIEFVEDPREKKKKEEAPVMDILGFAGLM